MKKCCEGCLRYRRVDDLGYCSECEEELFRDGEALWTDDDIEDECLGVVFGFHIVNVCLNEKEN